MKKALVAALKIIVPLGIGGWLIYTQYHELSRAQRQELFDAFGAADLLWLGSATLVGWLAHVSRGWRWRYLLEPIGHRTGFWNCYHGVMIGYFINMFVPRAGEASRAVSLYRTERVPFDKGFGTILAERVVDMAVLLGFAAVALLLQLDKVDLFRARIRDFNKPPDLWVMKARPGAAGSSTCWLQPSRQLRSSSFPAPYCARAHRNWFVASCKD